MFSGSMEGTSGRASRWAGYCFFCGVLACAFLNAFGAGVNVAVTVLLVALGSYLIAGWYAAPVRGVTVSDASLLGFLLSGIGAMMCDFGHLARVPPVRIMHSLALMVLCPLSYFFGRVYVGGTTPDGSRRILKYTLSMGAIFAALFLGNYAKLASEEVQSGSFYQYSGDCIALCVLIVHAQTHGRLPRLAYFLGLALIFMYGSRASILAFLVAAIFTRVRPFLIGFFLSAVILGIAFQDVLLDAVPSLVGGPRVIATVVDTFIEGNPDASLSDRRQYRLLALDALADHPLSGTYGYDFLASGYLGGHAHSVLGIWSEFGVVAFVFFVLAVLGNPAIAALKKLLGFGGFELYSTRGFGPLLIFLLVELVWFRHPESIILFFGVGALAGLSDVDGRAIAGIGLMSGTHRSVD